MSLALLAAAQAPTAAAFNTWTLSAPSRTPDRPHVDSLRIVRGDRSTPFIAGEHAAPASDLRVLDVDGDGHKAVLGVDIRAADAATAATSGVDALNTAASAYRIGLYAHDRWQLLPSLAATVGVRLDHDTDSRTLMRQRAALAWRTAPDTLLHLRFARSERTPLPGEAGFDPGSTLHALPPLRGEQIEAFEAEADQRLAGGLRLRATAYARSASDATVVVVEPEGNAPLWLAGQTLHASGVELAAEQRWAAGTQLRGSASWRQAATAGGLALLEVPQRLGKLMLSTPLPWAGLQLGSEWLYDAGRIGSDGNPRAPSLLSNLRLSSGELVQGLRLSLSVFNLLGSSDAQALAALCTVQACDGEGRSVRLQMAMRF
ncbi:MAG: TonB-dependent receptor [Rubrivivax sp.]